MEIQEYVEKSGRTAVYPDDEDDVGFVYVVDGLIGETGEVVENIKKSMRNKEGDQDVYDIFDSNREEFIDELGDVLWYWAASIRELNGEIEGTFTELQESNPMERTGHEYAPLLHKKAGNLQADITILSRPFGWMNVVEDRPFNLRIEGDEEAYVDFVLDSFLVSLAEICNLLHIDLDKVASKNLDKVMERKENDNIKSRGLGDG